MEKNYIEKLANISQSISFIDKALYNEFDIKFGLRNRNNTGVVVGITKIGAVRGYVIDDGIKVAREGVLKYRGIEINEIVRILETGNGYYYEKVCYLLLFGKLPDNKEFDEFISLLAEFKDESVNFFYEHDRKYSLMNALQIGVNRLYTLDESPDEINMETLVRQSLKIIACMPDILLQANMGKNFDHEKAKKLKRRRVSTAEYLLAMLDNDYIREDVLILDLSLATHADHGGGNNSTFTVRVVSSAYTDTYSAISAGIGSLKGLRHGGANVRVAEMMEDIEKNVDTTNRSEIKEYLRKILNKQAFDKTGLIYGMGHAIYTLSDPRCVILKEKAKYLANLEGYQEKFKLYENVEMLTEEVLKEEKGADFITCANVDLYSGLVYEILKLNHNLYTPIFTLARTAGWCAHRIEQIVSDKKIMRPAFKSF